MRVRAIQKGYYGHKLRKVDEIFDMKEEHYQPMGPDGKPKVYPPGTNGAGKVVKCSWVEPVDEAKQSKGRGKSKSEDSFDQDVL